MAGAPGAPTSNNAKTAYARGAKPSDSGAAAAGHSRFSTFGASVTFFGRRVVRTTSSSRGG